MTTTKATCGAKTRQAGECKQRAGAGTDHLGYGRCKFHTGSTASGRQAAAKEAAALEAAKLSVAVDTTPAEALELAIGLVQAEVVYLQERAREIEDGLVDGDLHPVARALGNAADRLAKVAKLGLDSDIEKRRVAISEHTVSRVAEAIRSALDEVALTDSQQDEMRRAFELHLTALGSLSHPPARQLAVAA